MQDGVLLKYGQIRGDRSGFVAAMGASEVTKAASGRFVTSDASGRYEICGSTSATIVGSVEAGDVTCSSTEGATKMWCVSDLNAVFRIPVSSGTYVVGMLGESCDLAVSSSIQGAALGTATHNIVRIVGGDAVNNNWVDVVLNSDELYQLGVV